MMCYPLYSSGVCVKKMSFIFFLLFKQGLTKSRAMPIPIDSVFIGIFLLQEEERQSIFFKTKLCIKCWLHNGYKEQPSTDVNPSQGREWHQHASICIALIPCPPPANHRDWSHCRVLCLLSGESEGTTVRAVFPPPTAHHSACPNQSRFLTWINENLHITHPFIGQKLRLQLKRLQQAFQRRATGQVTYLIKVVM